jgi:geranylgeranyl diphosphate synthase type II
MIRTVLVRRHASTRMNAINERALRREIERHLRRALAHMRRRPCPARLSGAIQAAVFPGGARIRPLLCARTAMACGADRTAGVLAVSAAIELIHCASLVHDDLPCFDNAMRRRGQPAIHHAFGGAHAVLAGDALLVRAFEVVAGAECDEATKVELVVLLAGAVGPPRGMSAGQAMELEVSGASQDSHRAKTAALFRAATAGAAACARADRARWSRVGERFGCAYQLLDDVRDGDGVMRPNRAPSAARAREQARHQFTQALRAVPPCSGRASYRAWLGAVGESLLAAAGGSRSTRRAR